MKLDDYYPLIYKQAAYYYHKIKEYSCYVIEDLVQEGVMVFYQILDKYDETKAAFSTYLTVSLRNHYSKITTHEYRNNFICSDNITTLINNKKVSYDKTPNFIEETFAESLSDKAYKAALIIGLSHNTKVKLKNEIKEKLGISTKQLKLIYIELERKHFKKALEHI